MQNRSVLLSGASSGLGKETAVLLAEQGYTAFAGVRKAADGDLLREANPAIRPLLLDVTNADHIGAAVAEIERQ